MLTVSNLNDGSTVVFGGGEVNPNNNISKQADEVKKNRAEAKSALNEVRKAELKNGDWNIEDLCSFMTRSLCKIDSGNALGFGKNNGEVTQNELAKHLKSCGIVKCV